MTYLDALGNLLEEKKRGQLQEDVGLVKKVLVSFEADIAAFINHSEEFVYWRQSFLEF